MNWVAAIRLILFGWVIGWAVGLYLPLIWADALTAVVFGGYVVASLIAAALPQKETA